MLTIPMLEKLIKGPNMSDEEIKLEYLPILIDDLAYIQLWEQLNDSEAERLFEEVVNLRLSYLGDNYYNKALVYALKNQPSC